MNNCIIMWSKRERERERALLSPEVALLTSEQKATLVYQG